MWNAGWAAEPEPASTPGVIVLQHCELDYKRSSLVGVAHMGTTSVSILQDCLVRLGDRVKEGQVLGRVMDREIRAELELRTAEAANDIDIRVNEARYAETVNKLKRSELLSKRIFVSAEELEGHRLESLTAKLQVEQSRNRIHLAEIQRRQAESLLHAREYVSPHDGVVVEIHKEQGEAVAINDPIFRVVEVDTMKITGYVNLGDYWRVHKGQSVRISPSIDGDELPVESEVFNGQVVFVDRRIDPTSRTCKIIAEVNNRELLLASGMEARMEILLNSPPVNPQAGGPLDSIPTRGEGPRVSRSSPADAVEVGASRRDE